MSLSSIACNAFLRRCPPQLRAALVSYLPAAERQLLETQPKTYRDPCQGISSTGSQLERIHPSWITPHLRNLTEQDVKIFLAALSPAQALELKKGLLFTGESFPLSSDAKAYSQSVLLRQIIGEEKDLLPIECLPESPLNALLELSFYELCTLIDFLGLHDLTVEMRHIIDAAKLKRISEALSSDELKYVKILMQSREPVIFPRMGLDHWQGEVDKLKILVRGRGLNRLAKGLYGQHPSLFWHLSHHLDVDRALSLQKLCTPLESPSAPKLLSAQILELHSFMRKPHE